MPDSNGTSVAIIDYGMGNLFSVRQACRACGLNGEITSSPRAVVAAQGVILPGVGAFGIAMQHLREMGMVDAIHDVLSRRVPFMGICLGMQLLMEKSEEFGCHDGLGIIPGRVVRFENTGKDSRRLKVPHVGWTAVHPRRVPSGGMLKGLKPGTCMYFVHSYYVVPDDPDAVVAESVYGATRFCSAVSCQNLFACQFHPERSGAEGLNMYHNFADLVQEQNRQSHE
jgi:glutamine amidotransferase